MEEIAKELQRLKEEHNADIIKIYFQDSGKYVVKFVKNGQVVHKIKRGIITIVDKPKENKKEGVVNKKKPY